jgi:catechol O-methyltransferase
MRSVLEIGGRRLPFLRWSAVRMGLGYRHLLREWQVGDGREEALLAHVLADAVPGDPRDAVRAIDEFCYRRSVMMNVGDEKGAILDAAVERAQPRLILELGAYCGYSALRMACAAPQARIHSIEFSDANAQIARAVWGHAGVADRVSAHVGTLATTPGSLFAPGSVDLVFIDHDKDEYLPDLLRLEERGWLRPGSVAVADNVRVPGAPAYRAHMREQEGRAWRTTEHATHVEYQTLIGDLVLESERLL